MKTWTKIFIKMKSETTSFMYAIVYFNLRHLFFSSRCTHTAMRLCRTLDMCTTIQSLPWLSHLHKVKICWSKPRHKIKLQFIVYKRIPIQNKSFIRICEHSLKYFKANITHLVQVLDHSCCLCKVLPLLVLSLPPKLHFLPLCFREICFISI